MPNYLCEDLIIEIFTRLPPKSLLRFKSLSKSLCSCISSRGFIHTHTFRSPQKVLLIHINDKNENNEGEGFYTSHGEDEFPFNFCPKHGYIGLKTTIPFPRRGSLNFLVIGSCNGILCVRTEKCLVLWNPSIRRKLSVPECPRRSETTRRSKGFVEGTGFGYDPISNDYKIVWISKARDSSFVYAVKMGTWCEIASPKPEFTYVSRFAYLFNGVLHWQVRYPPEPEHGPFTFYLQTFDLSTHVFGMISMPIPTRWYTLSLTTIHGSLALVSHGIDIDDTWIIVWKDSSWHVAFKLNMYAMYVGYALQLQPQQTNNGDLLLGTEKGIQLYNPRTGVRARLVDFNATSRLVDAYPCVETLHLLDVGEAAYETNQL